MFRAAALAATVAPGVGCSAGADAADPSLAEGASAEGAPARTSYSSPIALSPDDSTVWAVNPDTDTVSAIRTDTNTVLGTLRVGEGPQSVAVDPGGRYAYVANARSNDVSVIDIRRWRRSGYAPGACEKRITTGGAPSSVVVSPDGRRVFVANANQDTITVLDGGDHERVGVIDLRSSACNADDVSRHFQPRAMAITADSAHLYVTRFLSYTRPGGAQRADYGKEGLVCRLDLDPGSSRPRPHLTPIRLAPTDTGFADPKGNATGAFPNQLQSIVLRDGHAYLPNIAASPSGPLHFDVDTQAYVNRIDGIAGTETDGAALNLHLGAREPEPGKLQLFFANPWAMAFTTQSGPGAAYVVSAASDVLVKLQVDSSGALRLTGGEKTTRYVDLNDPDAPETSGRNAGKNPVGIVINAPGTRAYVLNYVSRNVSVVDLSSDRVAAVVGTERLPAPGSRDEVLLVGAELFSSSRGSFIRPHGSGGSTRDRLSEAGHQACSSCHPGGLTDGVIWQFHSGPRKTIAINGTTNPLDRSQQRIINASAIFDEFEDVDFNTRRVSGGEPLFTPAPCVYSTGAVGQSTNDPAHGLILGDENDLTVAPCVLVPFATPNAGRPQLRVQLPGSNVQIGATDALKEWSRLAVATPNRAMTSAELAAAGLAGPGADANRVSAGREVFQAAGCATCHGSGQWTERKKDFVSPPAAEEIATESADPGANKGQYLYRFLTDVGTFGLNVPGLANTLPGYPAIGGIEKDTNELDALGLDYDGDGKGNGFNTPSLLGAYSVPPYFHNGACETLTCVLASVPHRRAGLRAGQSDPLDDARARDALILFLESIDVRTRPVGGDR